MALSGDGADHIIVAGHYPVYSICEHGPTDLLVDQLKPLLEKYGVSAYLAGHDHCAEVLHENGIYYHGIGSANFNAISQAHRFSVPKHSLKWHIGVRSTGGFASATLSADTGALKFVHYSGAGDTLYEADEITPRAKN